MTFECPHGLTNASAGHVSLEQILDLPLTLYEAMNRSALEQKPRSQSARAPFNIFAS